MPRRLTASKGPQTHPRLSTSTRPFFALPAPLPFSPSLLLFSLSYKSHLRSFLFLTPPSPSFFFSFLHPLLPLMAWFFHSAFLLLLFCVLIPFSLFFLLPTVQLGVRPSWSTLSLCKLGFSEPGELHPLACQTSLDLSRLTECLDGVRSR